MDVLRKLRGKETSLKDTVTVGGHRTILVTPFLNYDPVTSVIFGLGFLTSIFHGDPGTTFPSTLQAGGTVSLEKQIGVSSKLDYYSDRNRWFIQANPTWAKYPQSTYDLGTDSPDASKMGVDLYMTKVLLLVYRQILPDLFTGLGCQYVTRTSIESMDVPAPVWDNSALVRYSREHGLGMRNQTAAGASANLLIDRRDHPVNASRGWFASANYRMFFKDFLGGSSDWQELYADFRTYHALDANARHRLGLWLYGDLVTGGAAPYFDLPTTGATPRGRAGRGYDASRYRGDKMAYGEIEYRVTITRNGLLGAVGFVNTETFATEMTGEKLFDSFATGGGAGLRILLDKQAKSNLCLDVGFGKNGSRGIWAGFQETF
ncbi:MAG: BamA/TamA family outer membrane protein [Candidatus Eisenbacteria bacterium]|nr:BamA/TamA family outer membrane protein [Candidatus Eisenbacteria bacterium]